MAFKSQLPTYDSHRNCKSFLLRAGNYLSNTRGSNLDINVISELEDVFYKILGELERWKKTEEIPVEIVKKIKQLTALSSALVTKIKHKKHTEPEYFDIVLLLGEELVKFSKNISVIIPVVIWADMMMSN